VKGLKERRVVRGVYGATGMVGTEEKKLQNAAFN
jgi:hypothetical protein